MGEGRGQTLLNQPSHFLGQDLDPPEPGVSVQGCGGLSQLLPGSPEDLLFPSLGQPSVFTGDSDDLPKDMRPGKRQGQAWEY